MNNGNCNLWALGVPHIIFILKRLHEAAIPPLLPPHWFGMKDEKKVRETQQEVVEIDLMKDNEVILN